MHSIRHPWTSEVSESPNGRNLIQDGSALPYLGAEKKKIAKFQERNDITKFCTKIRASTDQGEENKQALQFTAKSEALLRHLHQVALLQLRVNQQAYFQEADRLCLQRLDNSLLAVIRSYVPIRFPAKIIAASSRNDTYLRVGRSPAIYIGYFKCTN